MALARSGGPQAAASARRAALLAEPGDPALAREALTLALKLEPLDAMPRLDLARLAAEQGDIKTARAQAEAVWGNAVDQAARARAAFMLGDIARAQGDPEQARSSYERALDIEDSLLARNRSDPVAARWYARTRGRLADLDFENGDLQRARIGAEGSLAMLRACAAAIGEPPVLAADIADAEMRLGALELRDNQPASARRRFGEAIGRYEALAATEKYEPHWRAVLSDAWALAAEADYVRGAAADARAAIDKSLQARVRLVAHHKEEEWALAGVWRLRGGLLAALGDTKAASESYAQARAIGERLSAAAPPADGLVRFLVQTLLDQADHGLRSGELPLALEAADAARALAERRAQETQAPVWFGDAGACWDRLAETAKARGGLSAANDAFARAVAFRRMASDRAEDKSPYKRALAAALVKQGDCLAELGRHAEAKAAFSESAALRVHEHGARPSAGAARALAAVYERLGDAARACGDTQDAHDAWIRALDLAPSMFSEPEHIEALRFQALMANRLVEAGAADAEYYRREALHQLDALARAGALTEQEAELHRKLWSA